MRTLNTAAIMLSVVAGTLTAAGLGWYAQNQAYQLFEPVWVWFIPLAVFFVVGAVPALLLIEYRTVTPVIVCACGIWLWFRAEADPGPGDPLIGFLYITGPATIVLSFVLARIEIVLQSKIIESI
ncbi:hypothetical protein B1756_13470 [Natrarchaeobaculum aegyptiacum]|uniref:Uncharacterized protein n=1 Tax=Natrarchaeobaculum aegyptiacum TaxID=745377 RepID=A0A2Z2HWS7_9EURY|nr:hypothetical protein B1756_13470 [Natrarchaeobaculum aegyptiacum]